MVTKTKYPSFMGHFKTKAEAQRKVRDRKRYGYDHRIIAVFSLYDGKKYKGYEVMESQRPVRHTWWLEHLIGESVKDYLARMKRRGIKAFKE